MTPVFQEKSSTEFVATVKEQYALYIDLGSHTAVLRGTF